MSSTVEIMIWDVWIRIDGHFERFGTVLVEHLPQIEAKLKVHRCGTSIVIL